MTFGLEEFFRDVNQGLGEEKGSPGAVALEIDLEQSPDKPLGMLFKVRVGQIRLLIGGGRDRD